MLLFFDSRMEYGLENHAWLKLSNLLVLIHGRCYVLAGRFIHRFIISPFYKPAAYHAAAFRLLLRAITVTITAQDT